jgi:hypothetical protein
MNLKQKIGTYIGTIGCPILAGTTRAANRTFFTGSRTC